MPHSSPLPNYSLADLLAHAFTRAGLPVVAHIDVRPADLAAHHPPVVLAAHRDELARYAAQLNALSRLLRRARRSGELESEEMALLAPVVRGAADAAALVADRLAQEIAWREQAAALGGEAMR